MSEDSAFAPQDFDPKAFDPVEYINMPRWRASSYGLDRMCELLAALGHPEERFRAVHVAGTNGKGSTCAFTASILQEAGYRTGLFTSPYIIEFSDRIRIDGVNISPDELRAATLLVRQAAEGMADHPTEFELMFAVACVAFARAGVQVAVIEVGLGGRLDATNALPAPEVCAITPIALDHTDLLGDTIEAIAAEKAGIVKAGATVVMGRQEPAAVQVIAARAAELGCEVCAMRPEELRWEGVSAAGADAMGNASRTFAYRHLDGLRTNLLGSYQPENAACAIEIALALRDRGFAVDDEAIRAGLAATRWPGRFERVADSPTTIVDGGHNPQGAAALASSMELNFPGRKAVMVIGVLADKDYADMLPVVLPYASRVICTQPPNPRALAAADLADAVRRAAQAPLPIDVCGDIADAVALAREAAGAGGLVVAFGSLYSIASIMGALGR